MRSLIPLWIVLLLLGGCSGFRGTSAPPVVVSLSGMYNPINARFHPAFTVYHNDPGTSLLLVKIFPSELLFSGAIEPNQLVGQVKITYYLQDLTDPDMAVVSDSGVYTYNIRRDEAQRRFLTQIPFRAVSGRFYQLRIVARDQVRNEENLTFLYVDKRSELSEQNFMVSDVDENIPVFQPYVLGSAYFKLQSAQQEKYDQVFVSYYGQEIPLPRPSFSLARELDFLAKPDSIWILPFSAEVSYSLKYPGIYYLQLDTTVDEGLTLMHFGPDYPQIENAEDLIDPLAYLTTTVEYAEIKDAPNRKLALDNFWLDNAGNMERARELIRVYYNRIYYSNYYFTSVKPGWKTDRGMIFTIYGPPQSVITTTDQEKWVYYKNNYSTSVTFTFDFEPSPFTMNNYILERSENYDTYWRSAVNTWRSGNIYLIN